MAARVNNADDSFFLLYKRKGILYLTVRNQMPVSLRGGGGELGNLKTLTYGFTNFAQR
jgi:hypothetical protein